MTPDRWSQVEELFQAAMDRSPDERAQFLRQSCNGDDALRREVEALLAVDGEEGLDDIASGVAAAWATESHGHDLLGQTIGRYKILSPLGSGGMGEVFLADDLMLDRKVALKLLPRQFTRDRDRLRRFEQEARAASGLNHPNIITIYEIGEIDGTRFIAAEHVQGETLREVIGKPGRQISDVLDIGMQAASALDAAHRAGIVHRDIKPANIMLRADGFIKVLDFGLAKLTSALPQLDVTETGRVMGTINYMSPEQAMGQPVDHRSDIFSLGVVLYELATARRLFEGKSEAAVYDAILHEPPPSIQEFVPKAPVELDQVIRRALEKDPARRYQAAADFRNDLKRLTEGPGNTQAAAIAARERRVARSWRMLRYAATAILTAAVIAGALLIGGRFGQRKTPNESARKSLAVLPFSNLSGEEENAFFTEGMHNQVLTDLTKIGQLKVIGRTSVMQYKAGASRNLREIAAQLGAGYVLEGSVQRAGGKVRVNAQLIDANSEAQLWGETYDSDLADVFALQSNIAKAIAQQLNAELSAAERAEVERKPTSDVTAFDLYTRAKRLYEQAEAMTENSQENLLAAIDLLNQAVRRDPRYLAAYCQLSAAHGRLYWTGIDHSPARFAQAQAAIDAALRIAPNAGETHLANAWHLYAKRDFARVEQALAAAHVTLANDPETYALTGYFHRRLGRWEESTKELEKAVDLDPRNAQTLQELASNYHALHNYAAYIGTLERVISISPQSIAPRIGRASADLWWYGNTKPLRTLIDGLVQQDSANAKELVHTNLMLCFYERDLDGIAKTLTLLGDSWYGNDHMKLSRAFGEGMLARMKGAAAAADAHFTRAREQQQRIVVAQPDFAPALSVLGLVDAALGRKEDAVREGQRAVELLPRTKDSMAGPAMIWNLAMIAGFVGENDLALEQLRSLLDKPAGPQYGHLRFDPMFDPLRSDPRFEELVAATAPR